MPSSDCEYHLASWKKLKDELPWKRGCRKAVRATMVLCEAAVVSLDTRAKVTVNKPLLRAILPFLEEHLAGASSIRIPWHFIRFFSTGLVNSSSALKKFGAPWIYIYSDSSLLDSFAASFL